MMLTVIGDLVADIIVIGGMGLERGTDNPAEVRLTRGGSAANVAVAAAARHPVRFIGRVGDDTIGRVLADELEAAGVDVRVQRAGRTGAIVVLVDAGGERTMITDRGAAAELDEIDPVWLAGSTWLHLPLYGFGETGARDILLRAVKGANAPVSLDLSSVATMRVLGAERLEQILDQISPKVVFANADEAALADRMGLRIADATTLVVKRGGDPVLLREGSGRHEIAVERVADVVDTTGAGDAFAAGYVVETLSGASADAAARAGSRLAADAVRRAGALSGVREWGPR
jgi:sugar/nucleoside kinase (ribokinase family)